MISAMSAPRSLWRQRSSHGIVGGEGALVQDKAARFFADPDKIRLVDHSGPYFKSKGLLNVPRSPRGAPPSCRPDRPTAAGISPRGGQRSSSKSTRQPTADSQQPTADGRKAYYADIKHRAAVFDRDTDSVKISEVIHGAAFFNWANRLILSLGESVASSK